MVAKTNLTIILCKSLWDKHCFPHESKKFSLEYINTCTLNNDGNSEVTFIVPLRRGITFFCLWQYISIASLNMQPLGWLPKKAFCRPEKNNLVYSYILYWSHRHLISIIISFYSIIVIIRNTISLLIYNYTQ